MKLLATVLSRDGGLVSRHRGCSGCGPGGVIVVSTPSRGQLGLGLAAIVSLLQSIYDVIRNEIGKFLGEIRTLTRWFNDYYQLVLFPRQAIEAARAFATGCRIRSMS